MKKFNLTFIGLTLLLLATQSQAALLSLEPSLTLAGPGDSVSLDLTISGLGNGGSPSVGDFDIDISYDFNALSFTGYTLGAGLGDLFLSPLSEADDFSLGEVLSGIVNLRELSYISPIFDPGLLDTLQADSFILATLDFDVDTLAPGNSTDVMIDTIYALGDDWGDPIVVTNTFDATIRNPATGTTPEPSILVLMLTGIVGLGFVRRRLTRL